MWLARIRYELARRPWVRWIAVLSLALIAGRAAYGEVEQLRTARDEWGDRRTVLAATTSTAPGDVIRVRRIEVPAHVPPAGAVTELPPGSQAVRHLVAGEIVVADDLVLHDGPTAGAEPGTAVVGIPAHDVAAPGGTRVSVVADGLVLSESGTVLTANGETQLVAVPRADAAAVADAVRRGTASLVYLP